MTQKRKTIISTLIIIVVAALAALGAWWWHMTADTYRARSVAMVEQVRTTTLTVNGRRVPLITNFATRRADTIYHMGTGWQPTATDTLYTPAVWANRYAIVPSCLGRLATPIATPVYGTDSTGLRLLIQRQIDLTVALMAYYGQGDGQANGGYTLKRQIREQEREIGNLDYYLKVHGVQDEGYHDIARYTVGRKEQLATLRQAAARQTDRLRTLAEQLATLRQALRPQARTSVSEHISYTVIYTDGHQLHRMGCQAVARHAKRGYTLLQTTEGTTPANAAPLSLLPWTTHIDETMLMDPYTTYYTRYAQRMATAKTLPITHRLLIARAGTVPDHYTGYWISRGKGTITYAGYWHKGRRQGWGTAYYPDSMVLHGKYSADTLYYGSRRDTLGRVYTGYMDSRAQANGHGTLRESGGLSYSGQWRADRKEGFGCQTGLNASLRVGEWHRGVYRGERLVYTSDRIYGIDISRFQHEIGRKKYGIDWSQLRISHLGNSSRKRISGRVNYPISFIYIKATEGSSLRNRYYAADYRQARQHGLRTGSYHFFSTTSGAEAQARHFIRYARLTKGDLPPVLDVEPSPQQIRRMGGPAVLWQRVGTWLRIVERHTGTAPVLYISQMFVNRYLPYAPDIKRHYPVWIARYGEYKPDVRLAYWQLCPDGRVAGIRGEVDINVFNGYQAEFRKFVSQNCIK